jgi:hypothetical protein
MSKPQLFRQQLVGQAVFVYGLFNSRLCFVGKYDKINLYRINYRRPI